MQAFVTLFPPGLVMMFAVMGLIAGNSNWWYPILIAVPWLGISQMISRGLERSTVKAVDGMVRGMATVGKRKPD